MNLIKITTNGFKAFLALSLLCFASNTYAKSDDCWAEFYEDSEFKGNHFRLKGPIQLSHLEKVNGESWDKRVESVIVGPKAIVTVFENKNFKLTLKSMAKYPVLMKSLGITKQDILEDSEVILHPNYKIHSFGEFNFYHKIRSIKVECTK